MEQIRSAIIQARICIADITGQNPNVLYELGVAQTTGKPTILLTQDIDDVPFDVRSYRFIVYDPQNMDEARNQLANAIGSLLGEDRLAEAQRLIDSGMTRAAVAILGVLLEQGLRQLTLRNSSQSSVKKMNRRLGLTRMLDILVSAGTIEKPDASALADIINVRNSAVHELQEPTMQDALFMLNHVRYFFDKYDTENPS